MFLHQVGVMGPDWGELIVPERTSLSPSDHRVIAHTTDGDDIGGGAVSVAYRYTGKWHHEIAIGVGEMSQGSVVGAVYMPDWTHCALSGNDDDNPEFDDNVTAVGV
jgi:hypothetical protein